MIIYDDVNEKRRVAWVKKILANIPAGSKILDAGAGELKYKKYCDHLEYVSQDFGKYDGRGDGSGIQTIKRDNSKLDVVSDIIDIPVKNNSFDVIMCIEVFEHLPEPVLAIQEFARILKKKGKLIITAPFCSLSHYAPYHFASGFNRYYYETILDKYGFRVEEITVNGNYYEYLIQEINRLIYMLKKYNKIPFWLGLPFVVSIGFLTELLLGVMNKFDRSSSTVLCFGYQVTAIKI